MGIVFEKKDSVFFVGGRGTKMGDANAGGCTLDAWLNGPANKDLSYVMGSNGQPKIHLWSGSQTSCTIQEHDISGRVRITNLGAMEAPLIGLIVNVEFSGIYDNGRYEVLDCDEDGWIEIDLIYQAPGDGEPTCDVNIGGAFDTAQNAWNNTDATQGYNVIIHSNKSQSKTAGNFTAPWELGAA
ncbi:unnamed protein product, partial [marine sediment metagenome]